MQSRHNGGNSCGHRITVRRRAKRECPAWCFNDGECAVAMRQTQTERSGARQDKAAEIAVAAHVVTQSWRSLPDTSKIATFGWLFCACCYHLAMTSPTYTRARATAARQLGLPPTGKGAALTLHQITAGGDYVPGGGESAPTMTDYVGSGIRTAYKLADVDGTLVQASDVRFLVSPVLQNGSDMPTPQTGDTLTFGGTVYNVVTCRPWNFDGETKIGFVVQGRV